jgi:hypothetical protein
MAYAVSIADLRRAGIVLTADEVVAIADKLIQSNPDLAPQPPFGPLAWERIRIFSDGSVTCLGCAATPSVAELAILVQELLTETPRVPGGLRYAIARALHEVDAPPFDALDDFAATLARYAPRQTDDLLRRLVAKRDRRQPRRSASDLRMQLREADRRVYESQRRLDVPPPAIANARPRRLIGALAVGAVATIAAAGVVGDPVPEMPVQPPPPTIAQHVVLAPSEESSVHPVLDVPPAPAPRLQSPRPQSKRPAPRASHTKKIRLRWFHTTIAFRNDLAKPNP